MRKDSDDICLGGDHSGFVYVDGPGGCCKGFVIANTKWPNSKIILCGGSDFC